MVLQTERLLLRPWEDGDAQELYQYAKDPRVGPVAGWPPHTSVENSLEIIRGILSRPETYAVVLRETGKPVGSVGIMFGESGNAPVREKEAEIGYWIGVPYWGRGLIPEAVRELLRRCFEQLDCTGVWCGYYDGNDKSRRVQEKCGFAPHHTQEGVISPLGDVRIEHFTFMTKAQWEHLTLIKEFHRMWDGFPGLARLIDQQRQILAANQQAIERGFLPGTLCCQVKTQENHRECKLNRVLESGTAQVDAPSAGKIRGWLPVQGYSDVAVHFTLMAPDAGK